MVKRTAETKADKTGQWYANEAELAKLPTLIPSKEFVRAVLEQAGAENHGGVKSTPRKRRPRPEVSATRGFSISDAAAKLLAIKGIPDQREYSQAGSLDAMPGRSTVTANVAPSPGGLSSTYKPGPPQKVNYLYPRDVRPFPC